VFKGLSIESASIEFLGIKTQEKFFVKKKIFSRLPSLLRSLLRSHFLLKASLWPGSKDVVRKKHRRERKATRRSIRVFAECGGHIGRAAGGPKSESPGSWGKDKLARPGQEMKSASWFLRTTPLLPGRAMPKIQSNFTPTRRK
jgi:hypothetical protein